MYLWRFIFSKIKKNERKERKERNVAEIKHSSILVVSKDVRALQIYTCIHTSVNNHGAIETARVSNLQRIQFLFNDLSAVFLFNYSPHE